MDADGSNRVRLTDGTVDFLFLRWSPDGSRIASLSWENPNAAICVMNADGYGQVKLTDDQASNDYWITSWSPDSRKIFYYSYCEEERAIYVTNVDGTGQTKLADI